MNSTITGIIAMFSLSFAMSNGQALQQTDSPEADKVAVERVERETMKALLQADLSALDAAWADDYEFIAPNGLKVPKAAYLAMMKSGAVTYSTFEVEGVEVRVFGDSATATTRVRVKGQANGHALDGIDQALTVYLRRGGAWRQVATLATRVTTFTRS